MADSEPQKKSVNREHDSDKECPPNAPILEAAIFLALLREQRRVRFVPNDAFDSFFRRRRCRERGRDHDNHAKNPRYERAMVEGIEFCQELKLKERPAKNESADDRGDCRA